MWLSRRRRRIDTFGCKLLLASTELLSHIEVLSVRKAECTQGYWSINTAGSDSSQIADAIRQHDTVEIASRSKEFIRKGCNNLLLWQLCFPIKRYCRGDNIIRPLGATLFRQAWHLLGKTHCWNQARVVKLYTAKLIDVFLLFDYDTIYIYIHLTVCLSPEIIHFLFTR